MKKTLLFIVIFIAASAVWGQQKYALVIGNGAYTHFGSLPNAVNDANDITAALQSLGFTVERVLDADRSQMEQAIIRLKNRLSGSRNSYGFFYYAGHGLQHSGVNYLVPAKADIPSANYLGDRTVSVQSMLAELNDAGNELNIVVLDACRDFPAAWHRTTNRGLSVVSNQPADSIIVYATSAGSTAEDGTGRNGLFTGHLLTHLRTPGISVRDVFDRTGMAVSQASKRKQIPAIYSQYFGTAYLGTRPAANTPVQPASAVQPTPQPAPQSAPETVTRPTVTVANDRKGRINKAFSDALAGTIGSNSRYIIDSKLTLSEVQLSGNINKFIQYELEANLIDSSTEAILHSYKINGREGHSNLSEAENRALIAAERKINNEYPAALRLILSSDESVYSLLEQSYFNGYDLQEKLNAITALASLGTDESARRLAKFLQDLNVKRRDGNITREDEQMVRAIIPALGQTGRTNVMEGRAALLSVGASNWTPAVKALADNELKKYR